MTVRARCNIETVKAAVVSLHKTVIGVIFATNMARSRHAAHEPETENSGNGRAPDIISFGFDENVAVGREVRRELRQFGQPQG